MPTDKRRAQITLDVGWLALLGLDENQKGDVTGPGLTGALVRIADMLPAVTADLSELRVRDWEFLAEVCKRVPYPELAGELPAHLAIVAAVERSHREHRSGDRFFITEAERAQFTTATNESRADGRVKRVCEVVYALTALHGMAILAGVHWYWAHRKDLETATGEWWLPAARKKWAEERWAALKDRGPGLFSEDGEE